MTALFFIFWLPLKYCLSIHRFFVEPYGPAATPILPLEESLREAVPPTAFEKEPPRELDPFPGNQPPPSEVHEFDSGELVQRQDAFKLDR